MYPQEATTSKKKVRISSYQILNERIQEMKFGITPQQLRNMILENPARMNTASPTQKYIYIKCKGQKYMCS